MIWPFKREIRVVVNMAEKPHPMPAGEFLYERLLKAGMDLRKPWKGSGDWFGFYKVKGYR